MNHQLKKGIYNGVVGIALVAGIVWVGSKFSHFSDVAFTDNAQVKQLIVPVNSRVQGYVKEVRFEEYQSVKKGDTLLIIDDTEYRYRVAIAEAEYQNALAGKTVTSKAIQTVANGVSVTDAAMAEVKTLLDHAAIEEKRFKNLLAQESVTKQEYEGMKAKYDALNAKYETLTRQKQTTVFAKNETSTRLTQNDAGIKLAETGLELAKLNLSYTVIVAAADGFTGRKTIQEGQLIQPGQPIVDIIDSTGKWVIANYKETQTYQLLEGQLVDLKIDALPGQTVTGVIKSIANATGASFSVIPQDNSAGNFVKIEQRIPVRIEFTETNDPAMIQKLRAGMNVECTVKI